VQIGHGGLTDAVLAAIDNALLIHELIKVRVTGNEELSASRWPTKWRRAPARAWHK